MCVGIYVHRFISLMCVHMHLCLSIHTYVLSLCVYNVCICTSCYTICLPKIHIANVHITIRSCFLFSLQTIALTVVCSIVWFQISYEERTIQDRYGLLFFTVIYWSFQGCILAVSACECAVLWVYTQLSLFDMKLET